MVFVPSNPSMQVSWLPSAPPSHVLMSAPMLLLLLLYFADYYCKRSIRFEIEDACMYKLLLVTS
ncbi:hypothetical protein HanRHA438_Chr12g0532311 [Helianthus annuus]|nr:hypothetical protein HanRHA438_Chr12g0532311 [Helianthus annuus]